MKKSENVITPIESIVVWVDPPDDDLGLDHWTIAGDLRPPCSDYESDANYECRDALVDRFPNVDFDPESACFFAYAKTKVEALEVMAAVGEWVQVQTNSVYID